MSETDPEPQRLGEGIHLISVPLPFARPSSVNCYVIEAVDGVVLIDCGCDWDHGYRALERGLAAVDLTFTDIHTLVVTHLHPDHVGMVDRVVAASGARFVMHRRAARQVDHYNDRDGFVRRNLELALLHGVPEYEAEELAGPPVRPDFMPVISPPDTLVEDGDEIDLGERGHLEVLHTPGHDPSHICLRHSGSGAIFSGDHVLPGITPVVMYEEDYPDTLGDFLSALRRLLTLPIGITYPAHGPVIERGAARVEQLILHHERRLRDMEERLSRMPMTAWEMVRSVFRPNLEPLHQRLALRETIAHLEHLRLAGRAWSEREDGVLRYRALPPG